MAFRNSEIEPILERIHRGQLNPDNLPKDIYDFILENLMGSLENGFGEDIGSLTPGSRKDIFVRESKRNVKDFAGHKVYQQVKVLSEMSEGKSFEKFRSEGIGTFRKFNETYQEAEQQATFRKSRAGNHWSRIKENADLYPLLRYRTQGDDRVRDEHRDLEGITKPQDDPFWNTYFPPNGWKCRCPKPRQMRSGEQSTVDEGDLNEPDEMFNDNPGKTGKVFKDDHPYFQLPKGKEKASRDNFGFG